ncbi:hypothetical protein A6858_27880 [Salmonella enterica]|nr:hypothetical protein [Salmonella enterica]EAU0298606.1 hypothetical protein [Salmonella enterica]EBW8697952.1 hypothetical protein [Salmonella enterica subsp. diarizonae serovar 16:z10:e,n,x,z15]EIE0341045.1 hypothetical protein [Salmonella enterica]HAC8267850.1 hypothetical protein [Salmonella enterica]
MTLPLLRVCCLSLARILFLWPALLTGGVVLVMVFLLLNQNSVASRVDYYTYEAARWRNAPEGSLMVQRCTDVVADSSAFPVAPAWRVIAPGETDCHEVAEPFKQAAENDMRGLRLLLKFVLTMSFILELIIKLRGVRANGHRGAVAHVRMANGGIRIIREDDNE